MSKRGWTVAAFLSLAIAALWPITLTAQSASEASDTAKEIDLAWGVNVPQRDGVKLNATVYKPKDMREGLPVVCTMTPYIADSYHERGMYFARNGYVFTIVDITGHYDGDQPGALTFYRRHMQHGSGKGRERHYLLIGPWDHAGTRTPTEEVAGLKFGKASLLDLNRLHREWYDWTMKDGPKPKFLEKRVAYYVPGAEVWKYADRLEAIPSKSEILYLTSPDGSANDVFHSGTLDTKPNPMFPARRRGVDPGRARSLEYQADRAIRFKNRRTGCDFDGRGRMVAERFAFRPPLRNGC